MHDIQQEAAHVLIDGAGAPASRFFWRGRSDRIDSIERAWRSGLAQLGAQRLYRIRSAQRTFLLAHDFCRPCDGGRWCVRRGACGSASPAFNSLATRLAT